MTTLPDNANSYVLITPAKNEGALIRRTLESVVAQRVRPSEWIIVDDASTDDTGKIVAEYSCNNSFIKLVRLAGDRKRHFSNKAMAFNAGLSLVHGTPYSFIGNLDADIALPAEYYESVLSAFQQDVKLGIAGGRVHTTVGNRFVCRDWTSDSVGGAVQLFRRECFEEIGGYRALPFGGIDAAAEIMARSKGWRVQKLPYAVLEYRQTGSAQHGVLRGRYRDGYKFHSLGYDTAFFISRCLFRLTDAPAVLGSTLSALGFVCALTRNCPVCMPEEAVSYLRAEQRSKLRALMFPWRSRRDVANGIESTLKAPSNEAGNET